MLKKILSIFLTAALLISVLPVLASAESTEIFKVEVDASTSTVSDTPVIFNQGDEITVKIRASQNTGITSLKLLIDYDETALELVDNGYAVGRLFSTDDSLTHKVRADGDAYFIFYYDSYPDVTTKTGVFAEFKFVIKDVCSDDIGINVTLFDNEYSCVNGGEYVPFEFAPTAIAAHKIDTTAGVVTAPDCVNEGYTTYICSACEETVVGNIVAANGHTAAPFEVIDNLVKATCTETGSYEAVVFCVVEGCNEELSRETRIIPATGHKLADVIVENNLEPDCVTDGSYDNVVYCAVCEDELSRETVTVPMLGHTPGEVVVDNIVEAGCDTDGSFDTVIYCEVCEEELSRETTVVPAHGHTPGEAFVDNIIEGDCVTEGSFDTVVFCEVCFDELSRVTEIIAAPGHDLVHHDAKEPTHDSVGWDAYDTCTQCDYSTYVEIPALPYIVGDLNDDGEVTDADAIYLLYATFDAESYPLNQNADFDGDGEVTDADAIYLLYATFDSDSYPLD